MQRFRHLTVAFAVVCAFGTVAAQAQNITVYSGNGQFLCPTCAPPIIFPILLQAKVTAANGNPVPNATVNWAITNAGGSPYASLNLGSQTLTDANGIANNYFQMPAPLAPATTSNYLQATISASTASSSVVFTETMILTNPTTAAQLVNWRLVSPVQGDTLTGQVGQQVSTPLSAMVTTLSGGVPNVEVRVSPCTVGSSGCVLATTPQSGPSLKCASSPAGQAPNTTLTDSTGQASCNLVITGTPGTSQVAATIGGVEVAWFNVTATAGSPSAIRIISGNNQAANPGAQLPQPLVAEVDDSAGNAIPGATVQWDVPVGTATLSNQRTTADSNGRVSTNVTLGGGAGNVQVRVRLASNSNIAATFNETVNVTVSGIAIASGNNQTAAFSTPFGSALVVTVTGSNNQPVPGVTVNWAVTGGNATVNAASSTTNSSGQASINVSAGATAGAVTVTATVAGQSPVTFNLTVRPPGPSINSSSFVNAAGFSAVLGPALSPCSLATVTGTGIAAGMQGAVAFSGMVGPWSYQVANVTITVGNTMAPIYAVSNVNGVESATFQVPCETPTGNQTITVNVAGGSNFATVNIGAVSPGLFQASFNPQGQVVSSGGTLVGVMQRPDGSFVSPANPARPGETIRMYCTGLGETAPLIKTNQYGISAQDMLTVNTIVVGVNNGGVPVLDAKYAPNMIGVWEVDFQVPSGTPTGNLPLAIAVVQGGSLVFGNPSVIPVHQ